VLKDLYSHKLQCKEQKGCLLFWNSSYFEFSLHCT